MAWVWWANLRSRFSTPTGPGFGLDVDPGRVEGARKWGMEGHGVIGRDDVEAMSQAFSGGFGVDAVIVTASTDNSEPLELAGRILRERGRAPWLVTWEWTFLAPLL